MSFAGEPPSPGVSSRSPGAPPRAGGSVLLEVKDLAKYFPVRKGFFRRTVGQVRAVDGISFEVRRGRTLSLVGESGCGKTTAARTILRLLEPTRGEVLYEGESIFSASPSRLRELRRELQIVFQDPYGSLDPRMTVEAIVGEGLLSMGVRSRSVRRRRAAEALERTGLDPMEAMERYPHEFSGGQRQRISIARALAMNPRFIVCDEAVSSLDVSVEAQIINLLMKLQAEEGYTYLFISHDLSVVRHLSDDVGVMYLGRLAELGPAGSVHAAPHHPYTRALLAAVPAEHPSRRRSAGCVEGETPSAVSLPRGCRFHTRCPQVMERCRLEEPGPVEVSPGHWSWCFLPVIHS